MDELESPRQLVLVRKFKISGKIWYGNSQGPLPGVFQVLDVCARGLQFFKGAGQYLFQVRGACVQHWITPGVMPALVGDQIPLAQCVRTRESMNHID